MKDTRTHLRASPPAPESALAPSATLLLHSLLARSVIPFEDWDELDPDLREELLRCHVVDRLLPRLIQHGLLTEFQAYRIETGNSFGLVLGNYRVLDRLGAGGMGVVYRAEHLRMRRQVAIKVIQIRADQDQRVLRRFLSEIRAVAKLKHANIVAAFDAGETSHAEETGLTLHNFVMEYI